MRDITQGYVLSEKNGASLVLTMVRPGKRNALSPQIYTDLHAGITQALNTNEIANIIIQGADGFFCSGGDLDALATRASLSLEERKERIEDLHNLIRAIRYSTKPVIAAIEGGAAGAGASIALAADMLVASEDSYISMAYVKAGLVPDGGGTASLLQSAPAQLAAEITLMGERFPVQRLADIGVVNRIASQGRALEVALKLGEDLASGARCAQSSILQLLNAGQDEGFEQQLNREKNAMAQALGGKEAAAGISAFHERRKAVFPVPSTPVAPSPQPVVETALTRLFGTQLPIVAGGLMWLANADYVAAAAKAGIIGFITAASFSDTALLRAEIRRCREMIGDLPFGVNISMIPKLLDGDRTEEVFRVVADEGVRFIETSGRSPEAYLPIARSADIKVLHKVASLRHAIKAQDLGVDAVAIVGAECGGHPGTEMIGSFVNAGLAGSRLSIPWLIGGGVGNGGQIAAILAMGGSGAVIGTRFLVADEIWAHRDYKQALINATENDTVLGMHTIRNTVRALANETMHELRLLEEANPNVTIDQLMPLISGQIGRTAYETGDIRRGVLSVGQSLGSITKSAPLHDIVASLRCELIEALTRAQRLLQSTTAL